MFIDFSYYEFTNAAKAHSPYKCRFEVEYKYVKFVLNCTDVLSGKGKEVQELEGRLQPGRTMLVKVYLKALFSALYNV